VWPKRRRWRGHRRESLSRCLAARTTGTNGTRRDFVVTPGDGPEERRPSVASVGSKTHATTSGNQAASDRPSYSAVPSTTANVERRRVTSAAR
jgi:hypothetical protein